MCGIVGYVGDEKAAPIIISSLKKLEYRGYDSAGIATVCDNKLIVKKDIGKIDEIENKINFSSIEGNIGISHCRWATHGKVSKINAHPHSNFEKSISIVHNGIIENHTQLRIKLEKKGFKFVSDTDSEVIVHLIEYYYTDSIKDAFLKSIKDLDGTYAIGLVSKKHSDMIFAARNESPLIIGVGNNENFIASDIIAILKHTNKIIYLENKEIAVLSKEKIEIFSEDGSKIKNKIKTIKWNESLAEKGGYEDFMLKEINEQTTTILNTIEGKIGEDSIFFREFDKKNILKNIKRIIIVACGTSWHAGLVGEFMLEEVTRIPVEVEYASEFRYRNPIIEKNTLVMAISQSGETADTISAIKEAKKKGAKVLSIVNVRGSSIDRLSDIVLYTKAGPEIGVASTKAFTSQLIILYLLTIYLGEIKKIIPVKQIKNRIRDLRHLPIQIQKILDNEKEIKNLAKKFYKKTNALYLGRGINYPIALEGALKLKEVSYIHAEGYPAAEMKHGPIALIDKNMPVIIIATKDNKTYTKVLSNIEEVKARGGNIIAITSNGNKDLQNKANYIISVPQNSYILTPLLATIPLQLFAYHITKLKDLDPDKPRNLAKSVTVE